LHGGKVARKKTAIAAVTTGLVAVQAFATEGK
jgi:hypothetical protein